MWWPDEDIAVRDTRGHLATFMCFVALVCGLWTLSLTLHAGPDLDIKLNNVYK